MKWIVAGIAVLTAGALYLGYVESKRPTFSLKKDEWVCTESHTVVGVVPAGKVVMPRRQEVCDNYKRLK